MATFFPIGGRILVKPKGDGRGDVVAAAMDTPLDVEEHDIVVYRGGTVIEIGGEEYRILTPGEVLGFFR